jgi:hypothetical protein
MYDDWIELDGKGGLVVASRRNPALSHAGSYTRPLREFRRQVERACRLSGLQGVRVLDPYLMPIISDTRTMRVASDHLRRRGGEAPGPNGRRLEDLNTDDQWAFCGALAKAVKNGHYQPGPSRTCKIPKAGKPGEFRALTIQNVDDRLVGRAIVEVVQAIFELWASPFSFGFRPGRSRLHALATALALGRRDGRWCWAKADVANAFDVVPFERLMEVCSWILPADVVELLRLVASKGKRLGIAQGGACSPLLFNLYADEMLGRAWARRRPNDPLLRYADDELIQFRERGEAEDAHALLNRLARSSGLALKPPKGELVCDLAAGQSMTWLGFSLRLDPSGRPVIRIAEPAWQRLEYRLAKCHLMRASPLRAIATVEGWVGQAAPCFEFEDVPKVLARVRRTAVAAGFDELPPADRLQEVWRSGHSKWQALAHCEELNLEGRLGAMKVFAEESGNTPGERRRTSCPHLQPTGSSVLRARQHEDREPQLEVRNMPEGFDRSFTEEARARAVPYRGYDGPYDRLFRIHSIVACCERDGLVSIDHADGIHHVVEAGVLGVDQLVYLLVSHDGWRPLVHVEGELIESVDERGRSAVYQYSLDPDPRPELNLSPGDRKRIGGARLRKYMGPLRGARLPR